MSTRTVVPALVLGFVAVIVVAGILARGVDQHTATHPPDGGHVISAPPPGLAVPAAGSGRYENAIRPVYARDLAHYDLSVPINAVARRYDLSAAGLLATLFSECGLFTHSTECDRVYPPYDVSFGDAQIIVSTAGQYGIGDGVFDGYYGSNTTRVRNWENNPWNGIGLAARIYVHIRRDTGAHFPLAHVGFNCGEGNMHPAYGSVCWQNEQAFNSWYLVALHYLKRR